MNQFINYSFIFFRILCQFIIYKPLDSKLPLEKDIDCIHEYINKIESIDISNEERIIKIQALKSFITLNKNKITDLNNENNWDIVEIIEEEPLHLALKNIFLNLLSRQEKNILNILIIQLALELQLFSTATSTNLSHQIE